MQLLLYCYQQQLMYEEVPDEQNSADEDRKRNESQLVSIRKKLIEPNNILPAAMIRSQPPRHILPLPPQHLSRPGHRMPLDPQAQSITQGDDISTPKRRISPRSKNKSKNQLPEFKKREQFRLPQEEPEAEQDLLLFLQGSVKKILDYQQMVAFISRTAFLSNIRANRFKPMQFTSKHQFRQECLEYLKGNRHFASTPFAFDQPVGQSAGESYNFNEDLQFSDDFQSSNLYVALQCSQQMATSMRRPGEKYQDVYLLTVRLDYNTKSYGQWFYFKVKRHSGNRNAAPLSYKFIIINMTKNSSLFGRGLRVSVCRNGLWGKQGNNIRYYRNSLQREPLNSEVGSFMPSQNYHSLQFTLDLSSGEEIYVSYNEPYSYSRVGRLLDKMSSRFEHNQHNIINFKRAELCTTYLNNSIEVVTVSARRVTHPLHLSIDDKKVIFIMARTHPVETAGSHVVEGILNQIHRLFIESPKEEHRSHLLYRLLEQYILKIIPMANPDGVILGNSRCNLPGYDLNRCWKSPRYDLSKQVYSIKRHVFLYHRRVEMVLDLHAHSKKMNVFAYGCHDTSDPFSSREFPFLLSKLSRQDFLFQECRFTRLADPRQSNSQKKSGKDETARVFLYDSLRIPNIFTIENSYCAARNSAYHYDRHSYGVIGSDILTAISLYFSPNFKAEWNGEKREQPERPRPQQNHIKISLNASVTSDIQLKLTINSEKPREGSAKEEEDVARCMNPHALRERYLFQLRQREENIKVGLQKDNQVSESEEEDRIYEPSPKKKAKPKTSSQAGLRKARGEAKTDRLLTYINKNQTKPSAQKSSNKQSILNLSHISNTHSQTNLARITKLTKNKYQTINKPEEMILIPDEVCHEKYTKDRQKLLSRRQRPPTQLQGSRKQKNDNCLSIVEIGLNNEIQERQLQERIVVLDRFEAKDRLKTFHGFREPNNLRNQTEPRQQAVHRQQRQKDDEIKQYLRRIMKQKAELVQQEKTRPPRGQRLVRLQSERSRQSQLQFNDLRRSKLVILQNHKQFRLNHQKSSVPQ